MPLDVAVEEPDAWVIGLEAEDGISVGAHGDGVAPHRVSGQRLVVYEIAGFFLGTHDGLEGVAVEMEGVFAWVEVVEHNLDYVAFVEDEGVGVFAVDAAVHY